MRKLKPNDGYFRDFIKHTLFQTHKYVKSLTKQGLSVLDYKIHIEIRWYDLKNHKRTGYLKIHQEN